MTEASYYTILFVCLAISLIIWNINIFLQDRQCYQLTIDGETFQYTHHVDVNRWNKTIYFIDEKKQEHYMRYYEIKMIPINLKK